MKYKKYIFWLFVAIIGVTVFIFANNTGNGDSSRGNDYSPDQVMADVADGSATLLDVRSTMEYNTQHVPNAQNFDVELLKIGNLPDINTSQKIYVYCRTGSRSALATGILRDAGYENVIDIGGINSWIAQGGPVE